MLSFTDLRRMARARIEDARSLIAAGRYDGAAYLVGYAVEYRLKARVATQVLGKRGWPETKDEFAILKNLQSHNLDNLLKLSGRQSRVDTLHKSRWSFVTANWGPDNRYFRVGAVSDSQARSMLAAVEQLLRVL